MTTVLFWLVVIAMVALVPIVLTFWEALHSHDLRLPWLGRPFVGVDNLMWSSDYPHNESTFGYSEKSLAAVVDAVGPEAAVKIVTVPFPHFFASLRAMSAWCRSWALCRPSAGATAAPMLASTISDCPLTSCGLQHLAWASGSSLPVSSSGRRASWRASRPACATADVALARPVGTAA